MPNKRPPQTGIAEFGGHTLAEWCSIVECWTLRAGGSAFCPDHAGQVAKARSIKGDKRLQGVDALKIAYLAALGERSDINPHGYAASEIRFKRLTNQIKDLKGRLREAGVEPPVMRIDWIDEIAEQVQW